MKRKNPYELKKETPTATAMRPAVKRRSSVKRTGRRAAAWGDILTGFLQRAKKLFRFKITFKGHEGRWWRRGVITLGVFLAAVIAFTVLKPEAQIMNSVEIQRAIDRGILLVGVRDDVPRFNGDGEGLELELARLLAQRIFPDADDPIKYSVCTTKTVSTKISDGSIDVAIALLPNGESARYAYSYAYYTDNVYVVTLDEGAIGVPLTDITIAYVQNTPAATALNDYKDAVTQEVEQSFWEKLFGKEKETEVLEPEKTLDIKKYGAYADMVEALVRGDVDAVVIQGAYLDMYLSADKLNGINYYTHETIVGSVDYSFVSSSDEPAFMQLANMMIYEMKRNGELDELLSKYGLG